MQLQLLLQDTLAEMDFALVQLVQLVPPAKLVPFRDGFVYRHAERLPQQAIVQKLSRIPSGLRAAQILCDNGFFQEQGALQRIIDEVSEDAIFLSVPVIFGNSAQIHQDYLHAFFAEEFDSVSGKPARRVGSSPPRAR